MNGFLKNLLKRHISAADNVKPYIPGKFEPAFPSLTQLTNGLEMEPQLHDDIPGDGSKRSDLFNNSQTESSSGIHRIEKSRQPQHSMVNQTSRTEVEPVSFKKNLRDSERKKPQKKNMLNEQVDRHDTRMSDTLIPNVNRIKPDALSDSGQMALNDENTLVSPTLTRDFDRAKKNPDQQRQSVQPKSISAFKMSDSNSRNDELKPPTEPQLPAKEKFGHTDVLSSKGNVLPEWLNDFKNNQKQESKNKDSLPELKPVIKVNIGRIEVKAIMQPASVAPKRLNNPKPMLSLEDYLKQRDGAKR